jgi:hypothetical protein
MGWQDRDWAKLDASEFDAIYGSRSSGATPPPARDAGRVVRRGAGPAILVSLLAAASLGPLHLLRTAFPDPTLYQAYPRHVIYGVRGTNAAAPNYPGGTNTACTAVAFDTTRGWQCNSWAVDTADLPIVSLAPYSGTCTDAKVDETSGNWICLGTAPAGATTPALPS